MMTPCKNHGPSAWCYVNPDGSHVDSESCRCFATKSMDCPVKEHSSEAKQRETERRQK